MTRCVLHFGMPKTGSTSIQASLLAAGALPGTTYLNVGTGNSSRALATMFMDDPSEFHLNEKWALDGEALDREKLLAFRHFEQQLRSPTPQFLLSAEVISTLEVSALTRLREWLERQVDSIELVGYVRAPKGYMESELQQKVKAGRSRFDLGSHYPGYEERFGKLEKVFGRDRVRYWKFDPARFPDHDVVQDFAQRLSLAVPANAVQHANTSLTRNGLALLYIYRKHGPGYGSGSGSVEQNRQLQKTLREVGGPKLRLSRAAVEPILVRNASDMAWMEERLGESLAESLDTDEAHAIRGEADLLRPAPEALAWLAQRLGGDYPAQVRPDLPPETVAEWMHALRLKLAPVAKGGKPRDKSRLVSPKALELNAQELAEHILASGRLDVADDTLDQINLVLAGLFDDLRRTLADAKPDTALTVAGLGTFVPRAGRKPPQAAEGARPWVFLPQGDAA